MNLYEELGVDKNASKTEIKKAYKKCASAHHPDKPNGNHDKFQAVKLAYDVLTDPEKKSHYDETGEISKNETKQDPVEQRITQLFSAMINSEKFDGNIIDNAIDEVRAAISNLITTSDKANNTLKSLSKRIGRIKCKGSLNMYELILNNKIDELNSQISKMDAEHDVMEKVLTALSNYTDEAPESKNTWIDTAWPNSI